MLKIVAEGLHIEGGGLIAMDKHQNLFPYARFSTQNHLVSLLGGPDKGLVILESICKKLTFFVKGQCLFIVVLEVTFDLMVLVQVLTVLFFHQLLIVMPILTDEAELQFFPKLEVYLVESVDVLLEGLKKRAHWRLIYLFLYFCLLLRLQTFWDGLSLKYCISVGLRL